MSYDYLRQFIPGGSDVNDNWFLHLEKKEIEDGEKTLGVSFPSELKSFYEEIGFGMLRSPINPPKGYQFYSNNEVLPPSVAAHFAQAIVQHQKKPFEEPIEFDEHWINNDALDLFEPGDLPFFEIGDSNSFMVMKPHSENPNAVWWMGHEKIEDSFEQFIYKLYHIDPAYYSEGWADSYKA